MQSRKTPHISLFNLGSDALCDRTDLSD